MPKKLEVKNTDHTCARCGFKGSVNLFSRSPRHKLDPDSWVGDVCLACVAEEDKVRVKQAAKRSREVKEAKRKAIAKQKANDAQSMRRAALAQLVRKDAGVVTRSRLKQMQKEAASAKDRELTKKAWEALKRLNRELKAKGEAIPPEIRLSEEEQGLDALPQSAPDKLEAELPELDEEEVRKIAGLPSLPDEKSGKEGEKAEEAPKRKRGRPKADEPVIPLDWEGPGAEPNFDRMGKKAQAKLLAKRELAARELARRKLVHFVKKFKPDYQAGWVHHDVCRRLERFVEQVEAGKSPRLMLFMPPRHGKSLLASDFFPSWALGRYPHFEIIASSYAVSLPIEFSRNIRGRLEDKSYQAIFPRGARLRADSKSAEAWRTKQGGGYVAAGVGGGITGKGAHILVVDDPIKDAQEADSETVRNGVWNWWGSTAYTRLAPGGGVLVIQTRWHDDDLSGRLIAQMEEAIKEGAPADEIDDWEVIEYSAIAEDGDEWLMPDGSIHKGDLPYIDASGRKPIAHLLRKNGEALHADRFDEKRLSRIKRGLQPRHWAALYQQKPMPDEGEYFTTEMFRYTASVPPLHHMKLFAAADLAIGEKQQNDYSVIAVGGLDYNDQVYIVDVIRFKGDTFKIVDALIEVQRKYAPEVVGIEKGQLELAIKPVLRKRLREERIVMTLAEGDQALVPITDKLTRARPLQGRMQQGMVYFLNTQPWLDAVQHELLRFPGGVHDDIVDALAWLMRLLLMQTPPEKPGSKGKRKHKSWRDNLNSLIGQQAKSAMSA